MLKWQDCGIASMDLQGMKVSGPHPWLQHVVVAQCPGLAGEFALVSRGYTCVARNPVHGPWKALEEVGSVVVGSTLLFTEGQCYRHKTNSLSLSRLILPHMAFRLVPWNCSQQSVSPSQSSRNSSGKIKTFLQQWRQSAPILKALPVHHPFPGLPSFTPSPEPSGQFSVLQERKRVRRPSQYLPPFRGVGLVQSREENWTPPPQVLEQSPHGPQGPQPPA